MSADFAGPKAVSWPVRVQTPALFFFRLLMGIIAIVVSRNPGFAQVGFPQMHSTAVRPDATSLHQRPLTVPALPVQFQLEQQSVTGQVDAVHSPNVDRLLKPQYKLELERRHSQLVLTNRRVRRIAVTDSTVANYVQYTPKELSIVGLDLGKTDLTLWFEDDDTPAIYEVTVVRDESLEQQRTIDFGRLERRLTTLFPNSRVYLMPVGNQVLVRGQAYDAQEAQQILQIVRAEVMRSMGRFGDLDDNGNFNLISNQGIAGNNQWNQFGNQGMQDIIVNDLQIPGEYNVKMRVIVAEVNRSELRNMGLDWNVLFNNARHSITGALGGTPSVLSGVFENGEIGVFLNWLTTNGTVTLLAEPVLVTMSGHSASILGGGEYAVPTIIGLGGGQATTFRGFGTSMIVTPTVIDRDLIRLMVVPEFSSLNTDNSVNGIPGTNVKRVQTTVELREGQTLAIGGLISRQTQTTVRRIPLLGDIPYFGSRLFHAKNAAEVETELLVLVSPEIVRPMEPDEVPPLPNYYITHPNDHDLYKYGRTEGNPDTMVYQVPPFGTGATHGIPQGYSLFNPPATHPGFQQNTNIHAQQHSGGYSFPSQGHQHAPPHNLAPQPEYNIPPSSGNRPNPGTNYSGGPVQHFQPTPNTGSAPVPNVPTHAYPPTPPPLPPVPGAYPSQGRLTPDSASQPTFRARMASMFRSGEASGNSAVKTASWNGGNSSRIQ